MRAPSLRTLAIATVAVLIAGYALAFFYAPGPLSTEDSPDPENADPESSEPTDGSVKSAETLERWQIQHVLFPAMKRYLVTPKTLLDRDVVQVASLPDLYRVFERC